MISQATASSSAKCSWDKSPFNFDRRQESTSFGSHDRSKVQSLPIFIISCRNHNYRHTKPTYRSSEIFSKNWFSFTKLYPTVGETFFRHRVEREQVTYSEWVGNAGSLRVCSFTVRHRVIPGEQGESTEWVWNICQLTTTIELQWPGYADSITITISPSNKRWHKQGFCYQNVLWHTKNNFLGVKDVESCYMTNIRADGCPRNHNNTPLYPVWQLRYFT